ncbi:Additional periplasmic component NikK of nickel ECF transporter [Devosia sp. H5989]|nr:Additional periplasmic component NikK of nickel ECF transporter [Devosia sp. H5989]
MRRPIAKLCLTLTAMTIVAMPLPVSAHFQMLYPGKSALQPGRPLEILMVFTHPFHGAPTMEMGEPEALYVVRQRGDDAEPERLDLLPAIQAVSWHGTDEAAERAFRLEVAAKDMRSMGDYVFVLEPAPYYEATEDKFIQQFTKTIVNVGGVPGNWDQPVGLPAEIRPLDKPYANWAGGVFRGVVLSGGEPVPFAEIEVEYMAHEPDPDGNGWVVGAPRLTAPTPSLEALSIRADASGTFVVGLPKAGWWGIAALDVGPVKEHEGKALSQDAVIWVEATAIE